MKIGIGSTTESGKCKLCNKTTGNYKILTQNRSVSVTVYLCPDHDYLFKTTTQLKACESILRALDNILEV